MDTEIKHKTLEQILEPEGKQTSTNTKQQEEMQVANQISSTPSSSSSPSHEFSFNISIQASSSTLNHKNPDSQQSGLAIDLTPADEIFFHGHLLPLHFFPNVPISPRSSTNSVDGSALPIKNAMIDQENHKQIDSFDRTRGHSFNSYEYNNARRIREHLNNADELPSKVRTKAKSFSLFGMARRRKEAEGKEGNKKKVRFDMSHFLKRYVRMFTKGRTEDIQFKKDLRGEFSAPASMRTSPTNSGVLKANSRPNSSSNDSTMEELQAAIQAAIAHCKDSISAAENLKS